MGIEYYTSDSQQKTAERRIRPAVLRSLTAPGYPDYPYPTLAALPFLPRDRVDV
jgi:hypothetical protein